MNLKSAHLLILSLVIPSLAHCQQKPALNKLEDLEWKNRILLIHEKTNGTAVLKQLKSNKGEIDDRHLIWIIVGNDSNQSNYPGGLSEKLSNKIKTDFFSGEDKVVLIGKDGTVKARYEKLDLDKVYALIDTMPMRKREMKSQRQ